MGFLDHGSGLHLFGQQYFKTAPASAQGTEWFWAIGALITLIGATLTVVGLMVQKQSHVASGAVCSTRAYWMEAKWLLGGAIWLTGNLVCWIALGLAPQCILASINSWNIVVTLAIAPWWLGEPVSTRLVGSAALLVSGTAWVVLCGPREYQQHTVNLIFDALGKTQSICAFAVTWIFLLAMLALACQRWHSKISPTLSYFQYTVTSAIFACYASVMSKSMAKVIVASLQLSIPMYQQPAFWLFAPGFAVCAAAQVHFLNLGLKHGDAVMVLPTYEALSMTGQIVIGGLVFDEFANFDASNHAWFWCGVVIVLLGIISLVCQSHHSSSKAEEAGVIDEKTPLVGYFVPRCSGH